MSSKVCVMSRNLDPYDHLPESVSVDLFYGDIEQNVSFPKYLKNAANYAASRDTGWYTMIAVDTQTGESKMLFNQVNPKRQRVELNLKAKEAKIAVKRGRMPIPTNWDTAFPLSSESFVMESTGGTSNSMQSLIDSLGVPTQSTTDF